MVVFEVELVETVTRRATVEIADGRSVDDPKVRAALEEVVRDVAVEMGVSDSTTTVRPVEASSSVDYRM